MPASIFKDSTTAKVLRPNLDLNGTCSVLQGSSDPTTVAQNAPAGSLYLMSTGRVFKKMDAGNTTNWQEVGSGFAGKNYIAQSDAESGVSVWATYKDAAGALPVDGTGGSPTHISIVASGTTPLRGQKSFLISNSGSTSAQGEGVSYDFTIDPADQAKVISVTFDYKVASGTFVSGNSSDIQVYIYDVTNAQVTQLAPYTLQGGSSNYWSFKGVLQTASNSQSYRLIFHCATVNTSAWGLEIDNVVVGPQSVAYGAAVTDWQSYTLTVGATTTPPTKGTTTTDRAMWRRIGDSMEIYYEYSQTVGGAAGSGTYLFPLPSGYSVDTSKFSISGSATDNLVGSATANDGTNNYAGWVSVYNANNVQVILFNDTLGVSNMGSGRAGLNGATIRLGFTAQVPILGWSSTVLMSNDTDTRVVAASARVSLSGAVPSTATQINFSTIDFDTHGAFSGGIYTVKVPGVYVLSSAFAGTSTTAGTLSLSFRKNGTEFSAQQVSENAASYIANPSGSVLVQCVGGDQLSVYHSVNVTSSFNYVSNAALTYLTIQRLTGPAAIAATETVGARYTGLASGVNFTGTDTLIPYNTKDYDSHGAYSAGVFTCPVSGKYRVTGKYRGTATSALSTSQTMNISVYKGATQMAVAYFQGNGATGVVMMQIAETINCLAGDTLSIKGACSVSTTTGTAAIENGVTIDRVGN